MQNGSCLCGAVAFTITGPMRDALACHCGQCRKQSGHYWAATSVPDEALTFIREDGLAWYRASDAAKRGFCRECGATLFWKPDHAPRIAIGMGALEKPTGAKLARHVFVEDKGDYYEINDGLPQHARFSGGEDA